MKIIYLLILILFIVGCSSNDFPPEPGSPGSPVGQATSAIADSYAPPYSIFENNKMIFSPPNGVIKDNKANIKVSLSLDNSFIYKTGYIYTTNRWQIYNFDTNTVGNSNWIKGSAVAQLSIPFNNIEKENQYILAYSCKRYDGEWKCGCKSENDCGYWIIQKFSLSTECTETDNGKNYNTKGTCTAENYPSGVEDKCDGNNLLECVCEGNNLRIFPYPCEQGCEDGACIKTPPEPTPVAIGYTYP